MTTPIAIVGLGGVFPDAPDLAAFTANMLAGRVSIREVPPGRWIVDPARMATERFALDRAYSRRACFVEDIPLDMADLAVDAGLLAQLDPLYRLALAAGVQAWRDGITAHLDRRRVGVSLAAIALPTDSSSAITREILGEDFAKRLLAAAGQSGSGGESGRIHPLNAQVTALPGSLLASALQLGGGSFTLDAACASSLYAIKLACDDLREGRLDAALAGGVSRPECLYTQVGFSQLRALSPSGACRPFDAGADGLVVGEGAGVVLLKRLDDALAAGDHIYGVIRGIGLSNDIAGSLLAADSEGQLRAMQQAYAQAGWSPVDVDYIECHGTGTPLGDAVEFSSMRALWGDGGWSAGQCVLGSVKSLIGHLLTGAAAAGLIRTLLAMRAGRLPPTGGFRTPHARLAMAASPFRVLTAASDWAKRNEHTPRRAAVSAFGFGGINAHLLIEEGAATETVHQSPGRKPGVHAASGADPAKTEQRSSVAIVGMDVHVGALDTLRTFQEALFNGRSALRPLASDRWHGSEVVAERPGGYIAAVRVRAGEFRLPPAEIPETLPQQLLMLQVAARALDDAGLSRRERRPRMGAVIGIALDLNTSNFHHRWVIADRAREWAERLGFELSDDELAEWVAELQAQASPPLNAGRVQGALGGIVASRVAREFGLGGPSFGVSCGEASGLRALDIAARALARGEVDAMLVGAVDFAGDVRAVATAGAAASAAPADGAAALVLQRADDAEAAHRRTYATVRGLGFTSGGEIALAHADGRRSAVERACANGQTPADTLGLVVVDGDVADALSLGLTDGDAEHACAVASADALCGHAGASAGLVALAAAALALHQQMLPVLPDFEQFAAGAAPAERLFVPREPQAFVHDRVRGPRRAVVSSAAADGTCACAILEETQPEAGLAEIELRQPLGARTHAVFVIGGADVAALSAGLTELVALAERQRGHAIEQLARAWWAHRPLDPQQKLAIALRVDSPAGLRTACAQALQHLHKAPQVALRGADGIHYTPAPLGRSGQVAFVFPGSGNHYLGMGRDLAAQFPEVLRAQHAETATLASQLHTRLFTPQRSDYSPGWREDAARRIAADNRAMIMAQVTYGALMSDVLAHLGLAPHAVIGYSLGETAGLFALRAWRDRDAMFRRMQASPLFASELAGPCDAARRAWRLTDDETVDWRVVLVNRPASEVRQAVLRSQRVHLLITNAPEECVIGGRGGDVEDVLITLGCEAIDLVGASAVHCGIVREVADAYRELHLLPTTSPDGVRFYSAAGARAYAVTRETAASSILQQALDGFDFPKLIQKAYADGVRVFVEVGPQNSCTRMIGRILADQPHCAIAASGPRELPTLLDAVAALVTQRVLSNLDPLYGGETRAVAHQAAPAEDERNIVVPTGGPPPEPRPPRRGRRRPERAVGLAFPTLPAGAPAYAAVATVDELAGAFAAAESATTSAHDAYLRFARTATEGLGAALQLQASLLAAGAAPAASVLHGESADAATALAPADLRASARLAAPVAYPRELCMEFAIGSVARVLGPEFAEVDTYPVRVRLPDEPLMLVDRILEVEGVKNGLGAGRVVTEHDVRPGDWYLDGGAMPTAITVESGQADLFLCAYLGIDLRVRGKRAYRLLDAAVNFHRHLPRPGETVRYDIRIDRFVRQGETYLFFFEFDGSVNGVPVLTMRNGCAGFFTEQEIRDSGGIIETAAERAPSPRVLPPDWQPLAPLAGVETYSVEQVDALRRGDLAACFGAAFADLPLRNPVRLPGGRLRLVDRVVGLEPAGGRYGLGLIRAEADIHPDDWFLTCHFVDDMVMPGTLMYECCMHTLRILLMRLGWVAEHDAVCYEPVPGVASALRCRGPVTAATRVVTYEVHVKELGYRPEPFALADALMYADGEKIVRFTDMSVKLSGLSRADVDRLWQHHKQGIGSTSGPVVQDRQASGADSVQLIGDAPLPLGRAPAVFDYDRILAFAIGKPSDAFGAPYRVFDAERRIARLPGPPYQVLDRITQTRAEPWKLAAEGWIEGQYDVPPDAWYFAANRQRTMPFAVLLEIALQPCGWLAAFAGSALRNAQDLSFRNLGGTATLHAEVLPDAGTLTTRVRMTRASEAGGMIIEDFQMQVWRGETCIYDGTTNFGFFTAEALAKQVGIRDAAARRHTPDAAELARHRPLALPDVPPLTPDDAAVAIPPGAHLPGRALRMVDEITCYVPDGGPKGLGYVRGVKRVDPSEWFFAAHFFQDPVCPGSLGLESFLQLLKAVALDRWGARVRDTHRFTAVQRAAPHTWVYRGQIIPTNRVVTVEAMITAVDDGPHPLIRADGFLSVDGVTIYEMRDFGLALVPV